MTENNTIKPPPPKRPQCAFFIYKSEVYQQVKQENPGKKMTDITKIVSEQYKKLGKDQMEQYDQKYNESKLAFAKIKEEYESLHGKIKNEKRKKSGRDDDGKKLKKQEKNGKKNGTTLNKEKIDQDDDQEEENDDDQE